MAGRGESGGGGYPKAARLRLERDFGAVRRGRRFVGREAVVRVAPGAGRARLGLGAPRGYGGSVRRNRFRRLVREAFRQVAAALPPLDLLVQPAPALYPSRGGPPPAEPTLDGLREDLLRAVEGAR
jgi:ribonuclease P protein component